MKKESQDILTAISYCSDATPGFFVNCLRQQPAFQNNPLTKGMFFGSNSDNTLLDQCQTKHENCIQNCTLGDGCAQYCYNTVFQPCMKPVYDCEKAADNQLAICVQNCGGWEKSQSCMLNCAQQVASQYFHCDTMPANSDHQNDQDKCSQDCDSAWATCTINDPDDFDCCLESSLQSLPGCYQQCCQKNYYDCQCNNPKSKSGWSKGQGNKMKPKSSKGFPCLGFCPDNWDPNRS